MKIMRPFKICLLLSPFILGGCTLLPVSFQIASLAMDGISLAVTQKSLTDHGISAITQKDCALWRSVTDKNVCQEEDSLIETALTDASVAPRPSISSPYLRVI